MRGALVSLLGALAGVAAGSALTSETVAAIFTPTPVVWDATACAAGIYEITSTARNTATGETFVAPTTTTKLPRPRVIQEFSNLPPGTYFVTSVLRRHDGLVSQGGTQVIGGPGGGGMSFEARRRAPGRDMAGRARSRQQRSGDDRSEPLGSVTPQPPFLIETLERGTARARSTPQPIHITVTEAGAVFIHDPDSRPVELVDTDDDGHVDLIRIEFSENAGWIWRAIPVTPGQATTLEIRVP